MKENEGVHQAETPTKKLVYVEEFKNLIRENPGVISDFKEIDKTIKERITHKKYSDEAIQVGDIFEKDNVRIIVIDAEHLYKGDEKFPGVYLKVEIGDKSFFVKRINGYFNYEQAGGANELLSTQKAKELLEDIEDVEVVDFQLGYQEESGPTYFVSKWVDGITLNQYIDILRQKQNDQDKSEETTNEAREALEEEYLNNRMELIYKKLRDFYDVGWDNILYCPKTKKLFVFDVHYRRLPEEDINIIKRFFKNR